MKKLAKLLCKLEGGKKQVDYAQYMQAFKLLAVAGALQEVFGMDGAGYGEAADDYSVYADKLTKKAKAMQTKGLTLEQAKARLLGVRR